MQRTELVRYHATLAQAVCNEGHRSTAPFSRVFRLRSQHRQRASSLPSIDRYLSLRMSFVGV